MSIYLLVIIYKVIFEFLYNVHIYIYSHCVIINITNENDTTRRKTQTSHCFFLNESENDYASKEV